MIVLDRFSEAGSGVNEDLANSSRFGAWVLDGATNLGDKALLPGDSDALWFVDSVNSAFSRLADNRESSLKEIVKQTLEKVRRDFQNTALHVPTARHEEPSAGMVFARILNNQLELGVLGDCKAIVRTKAVGSLEMGQSFLEELDAHTIREMVRLREEFGTADPQQLRQEIMPILRQNRAKMNTPDGYWLLGLNPESADHVTSKKAEFSEHDRALLMTDGFYRLIEPFKAFTPEGLIEQAESQGLEELYELLRTIEQKDENCIKYPRIKRHDDATALLLSVEATYS